MKKSILPTLLLVMLLTSGCNLPTAATPTPEPTVTSTVTTTPTAVPPTATTAPTEIPTATTIAETPTPAATLTAVPTNAPCVYNATLTSQSPQDNQEFAQEESFTKTWTLKNTGTCAWDGTSWMLTAANAPGDTALNSGSGAAYRIDQASSPKRDVIIVGDSITLTLAMKSPDQWGTFTQNWQLIDADTGKMMSITGTAGQTIYARIVVPESDGGSTGEGQKPTVEIQSIALQDGTTACTSDAVYNITAKIIGKANATVSYTISANGNGAPQNPGGTVTLNKKGGYDINTTITGAYADAGNLQITVTALLDGEAVNYTSASICEGGAYKQ